MGLRMIFLYVHSHEEWGDRRRGRDTQGIMSLRNVIGLEDIMRKVKRGKDLNKNKHFEMRLFW